MFFKLWAECSGRGGVELTNHIKLFMFLFIVTDVVWIVNPDAASIFILVKS